MSARETELQRALESLLEWEQTMGGWEGEAWRNARRVARKRKSRRGAAPPGGSDRGLDLEWLKLETRGYRLGALTLGHLVAAAVDSGRITRAEAEAAFDAWESGNACPDAPWESVIGPALDQLADVVREVVAEAQV